MKIKMSIPVLQSLTNNEAFTFFCTLVVINQNPDCTIKDIVRLSGVCETTIFAHLKKFEGQITIDRSRNSNKYSYTNPSKFFITIDSSLLNANVDRIVIGSLIRLKCWSRIATNIVDLSLNRIVHEIGIQHNTMYSAIDSGLVERGEKKLFFKFLHPALILLD